MIYLAWEYSFQISVEECYNCNSFLTRDHRLDSTTNCSQLKTGEIDKQLSLKITDEKMKLVLATKVGSVNISEYLTF